MFFGEGVLSVSNFLQTFLDHSFDIRNQFSLSILLLNVVAQLVIQEVSLVFELLPLLFGHKRLVVFHAF